MAYKEIMKLIPTLQATALVGQNIKTIKKKKSTTKDIMDLGVTNIVGTSLIKTQANLIGSL
jgi:hypothetical protein